MQKEADVINYFNEKFHLPSLQKLTVQSKWEAVKGIFGGTNEEDRFIYAERNTYIIP